MTYRIEGLKHDDFATLVAMDDAGLAEVGAIRVTATPKPGFFCRITLKDAEPGETLILLNHVSHDVATPYRSSYAIYVLEDRQTAPALIDRVPPVFEGCPIAFRAFDAAGMLKNAALALPGEADAKIRQLFESAEIDYLHAHHAAHGCFAARVDRH